MELYGAAFCIDQYEASTVEIRDDGTDVPHSPFLPVAGLRVKAVSRKGAYPQAYISRNEAEAACKEAGKRLCTDNEWITACKGPKRHDVPYGNERKAGYCVDANRVSPLDKLFGGARQRRYQHEPMNDPRLNQIPGTLAPTGSFARVHQLVSRLRHGRQRARVDGDPKGTFRGGYYLDTHINGEGCDYRTVAHPATYHDYSTGFRCCAGARVERREPQRQRADETAS